MIADRMFSDRIIDLHVHSAASGPGLDLPSLLEVADRRGLRIGVSDHVGPEWPLSTEAKLHEHLDELADYPVLRAVELELGEEVRLSREAFRRLDYVIGGLHTIKVRGQTLHVADRRPVSLEPEAVVQAMVDRLVEAMEEEPIDVLAHPTVLPHALRPRAADLFHDGHLDRIGRAAAETGVALELSGRLRLPHERAVERWLAAGARLAIGSGGYSADEIGELTWPFRLLERFLIDPERLYWGRD